MKELWEESWWGFISLGFVSLTALIIAVLLVVPKFERNENTKINVEFNPLFFGLLASLLVFAVQFGVMRLGS